MCGEIEGRIWLVNSVNSHLQLQMPNLSSNPQTFPILLILSILLKTVFCLQIDKICENRGYDWFNFEI